jgi:hypothetical protein
MISLNCEGRVCPSACVITETYPRILMSSIEVDCTRKCYVEVNIYISLAVQPLFGPIYDVVWAFVVHFNLCIR